MKEYFEFYNPVKILAGNKALENMPYELDQLGVHNLLILTDKGVRNAGLVKYVVNSFENSPVTIADIVDDIPSDSSINIVNEIAKIYRTNQCDGLVAIGGGSVIDTAKGVNILVSEKGENLIDFAGADILKKPLKPFIVIPTTAGTGSEVTIAAMIKDEKTQTKMGFTSPYLLPNIAILDPRMTLTLPPRITAATGMDALTHAIEAYTCLQKNPLSDAYAWKAIEIISNNLIPAVENGKNSEIRLNMALAATMAGIAFSNSMVGMVHSLGHAVGAVAHVHHGVAMSIFLPYVLRYNLDKIEKDLSELLLPLTSLDKFVDTPKDERANKVIEEIFNLREKLNKIANLPKTLKEAGVKKEQFDEIAQKAINDGSLTVNPKDMFIENALTILEEAY